LKTDF